MGDGDDLWDVWSLAARVAHSGSHRLVLLHGNVRRPLCFDPLGHQAVALHLASALHVRLHHRCSPPHHPRPHLPYVPLHRGRVYGIFRFLAIRNWLLVDLAPHEHHRTTFLHLLHWSRSGKSLPPPLAGWLFLLQPLNVLWLVLGMVLIQVVTVAIMWLVTRGLSLPCLS